MTKTPTTRKELLALIQRFTMHDIAQRLLYAIDAAGLAIVPREPTEEMQNYARNWRSPNSHDLDSVRLVAYRAMIAAGDLTKE